MKTIMVATDFSERSDRAIRRATLLAKQTGAGIVLAHVIDDDLPERMITSEQEATRQLLGEQAVSLRNIDGIAAGTHIMVAALSAGLARAAAEIGPDLLVIGPHRRQALRDVFTGTTAERTIRTADCPVLMANAPPAAGYRRILFATDLSDPSGDALRIFSGLGIAGGAQSAALHVFGVPALGLAAIGSAPEDDRRHYLEIERRHATANLSRFLASLGTGHMDQITRPEDSSVANEILAQAREMAADLIVVGTRGQSGFMRLVLGSVAEQVLRSADRDVLAVPPLKPR